MKDSTLNELSLMKESLYELSSKLVYSISEHKVDEEYVELIQLFSVVGCLINTIDLAEELG